MRAHRLQALYPEDELTFVIGPDNLLHFGKFYKADEILQRWTVMACLKGCYPQYCDSRCSAKWTANYRHDHLRVERLLHQQQLYTSPSF